MRAAARWLEQRVPSLSTLVNNVGIQPPLDFLKGARHLQDADQEVLTNLVAPIHLIGLLVPRLRKRPEAAVVNISSRLGFTLLAAVPIYCATKAAIHSLTLSFRHQLRGTQVRSARRREGTRARTTGVLPLVERRPDVHDPPFAHRLTLEPVNQGSHHE